VKTYYENATDASFNSTFSAWKGTIAFEGLVTTDEELGIMLDMIFANGRENGAHDVNLIPDPI
jgi:hypothetical protein